MPLMQLPIQSVSDTAVDNINTRCLNMRAVQSPENAIAPFYLQSTDGLVEWTELGDGPIRAEDQWQGNSYIASGGRVYKVEPDTTVTEWGTISNGGNMPMKAGFNYILTVDGNGYVYLIDDDGVELITTPDLVQDLDYFQGVFVFIVKDAANPGEYFTSKITPDLGEKISFDVADFANAETESDAAVGVARKGDLLWIIGEETTETFAFGTGIPFPAVGGVFFDVGCASRDSIIKSTNNIYWIGNDLTIRENGAIVSSLDVNRAIKNAPFVDGSYGFTFKESGEEFVGFTFGLSSTWIFDIRQRIWHERETYNRDYWQATIGFRFAGKQLIGDSLSGKVFELSEDVYDYDGQPRICLLRYPYVQAGGNEIIFGQFETLINMGAGNLAVPDPMMMIRYSKDGGRKWSDQLTKRMGAVGEYNYPVQVARMGRGKNILIEQSVSDAVPFQVIQSWMGAKVGSRT